MAIRFIVLFLESAFVQLFQTESAYKVFWMEFPKHSRNTATGNWFVTTGAQRTALQMIVGLAIWLTFVIEEGSAYEWLSTILKIKITSNT